MARHPQALKSCRRAPWTTRPEPVFEPSPSWKWPGIILTHTHTDVCSVRDAARVWQDPAPALQHVLVHVGGPQGQALVSLPTSCCLCLGLGPSNPIFRPQGAHCWEPPLGDALDKAEGPFAGGQRPVPASWGRVLLHFRAVVLVWINQLHSSNVLSLGCSVPVAPGASAHWLPACFAFYQPGSSPGPSSRQPSLTASKLLLPLNLEQWLSPPHLN